MSITRSRLAVLGSTVAAALLVATTSAGAMPAHHHDPNRAVFDRHAHPYGASMTTWGERLAQWIYGVPLEHNPGMDQTGADCAVDQRGPVWFVPSIFGAADGTRTCTIPRGKALFLDLQQDVQDYPCPDPSYRPAPGQSLYDFLLAQDKPVMDALTVAEVTLDGVALHDELSYRYISPNLFPIKGDPTMAAVDPCITGGWQPAMMDGFFMMFKPLSPGQHTITVHVVNTVLGENRYTYHLTIA